MNAVQKLRQIVDGLQRSGPLAPKSEWDLAGRLLGRLPADQAEVKRVCAVRDLNGLDALVALLERPDEPPVAAPEGSAFSPEELDKAYRAFRKRLKVSRLAEESKLGGRQLTGGRKSEIDAILPPHEFPREVWRDLARAGRLKDVGHGFYSLP